MYKISITNVLFSELHENDKSGFLGRFQSLYSDWHIWYFCVAQNTHYFYSLRPELVGASLFLVDFTITPSIV
jgi:hypothetical protein